MSKEQESTLKLLLQEIAKLQKRVTTLEQRQHRLCDAGCNAGDTAYYASDGFVPCETCKGTGIVVIDADTKDATD